MTHQKAVLITGAAGAIGTTLRTALAPHCRLLRSADIVDIAGAADNEEIVRCDLRDAAAVERALAGIDTVFHFGGLPLEDSWEAIRGNNIDGTYHVYEGARRQGVGRVILASSNHVLGFRRRALRTGPDEPLRPDSRYGVGKVFAEALARLYADKYRIETINLRIGQFRPRPTNRRMLSLWLSPADMGRLALCCLNASGIHFETVYAISANRRAWYDNPGAARIGFAPRDDAEGFAAELPPEAMEEDELAALFQGGPFCSAEFEGSPEAID